MKPENTSRWSIFNKERAILLKHLRKKHLLTKHLQLFSNPFEQIIEYLSDCKTYHKLARLEKKLTEVEKLVTSQSLKIIIDNTLRELILIRTEIRENTSSLDIINKPLERIRNMLKDEKNHFGALTSSARCATPPRYSR